VAHITIAESRGLDTATKVERWFEFTQNQPKPRRPLTNEVRKRRSAATRPTGPPPPIFQSDGVAGFARLAGAASCPPAAHSAITQLPAEMLPSC